MVVEEDTNLECSPFASRLLSLSNKHIAARPATLSNIGVPLSTSFEMLEDEEVSVVASCCDEDDSFSVSVGTSVANADVSSSAVTAGTGSECRA